MSSPPDVDRGPCPTDPMLRLGAAVIDLLALCLCWSCGVSAVAVALACLGIASEVAIWVMAGMGALLSWLCFALMESSPLQATPGKAVVGIRVTDLAGDRISFGRSAVRQAAKLLSAL